MSASSSAGIGADPYGLARTRANSEKGRRHSLTNAQSDFTGNGDLRELTPDKTLEEANQRATAC